MRPKLDRLSIILSPSNHSPWRHKIKVPTSSLQKKSNSVRANPPLFNLTTLVTLPIPPPPPLSLPYPAFGTLVYFFISFSSFLFPWAPFRAKSQARAGRRLAPPCPPFPLPAPLSLPLSFSPFFPSSRTRASSTSMIPRATLHPRPDLGPSWHRNTSERRTRNPEAACRLSVRANDDEGHGD